MLLSVKAGLLEHYCPRVKLRPFLLPDEKMIVDFKLSHVTQEYLILNMKADAVPAYFPNPGWWARMAVAIVYPVTLLHEAGLISDVFKDHILTMEESFYHEKKNESVKRREYKVPADDKALIDAFIVQRHNRFEPFILFRKENFDLIKQALDAVSLDWDSMQNEFESCLILSLAFAPPEEIRRKLV